jgi:class 3 adenylate cyclase
MAEHSHQLAAILFADVVGYTSMMQENEESAVQKINRFIAQQMLPNLQNYSRKICRQMP